MKSEELTNVPPTPRFPGDSGPSSRIAVREQGLSRAPRTPEVRARHTAVCPRALTDSLAALEACQAFCRPDHSCAPSLSFTSSASSVPALWAAFQETKLAGCWRELLVLHSGREARCQAGDSWCGLKACARWAGGALGPSGRPRGASVDQPFCLPLFPA